MSLTVSVDVKQHWTMLMHWSQFVHNMSTWHPRTLSSTSSSANKNELIRRKLKEHSDQDPVLTNSSHDWPRQTGSRWSSPVVSPEERSQHVVLRSTDPLEPPHHGTNRQLLREGKQQEIWALRDNSNQKNTNTMNMGWKNWALRNNNNQKNTNTMNTG